MLSCRHAALRCRTAPLTLRLAAGRRDESQGEGRGGSALEEHEGEGADELCCSEGAMMMWVEGARLLRECAEGTDGCRRCWGGVDPEVLLSDTRVLDVLLHNSDRHHGVWREAP